MEWMAPGDCLYFELEEDPTRITSMGGLLVLKGNPGLSGVGELCASLSDIAPRMKQLPVDASKGVLLWADAPGFKIEHHLEELLPRADVTVEAALGAIEEFYVAPYDPAYPRWKMAFVDQVSPGLSLVFNKLHHGLGDGTTLTSSPLRVPLRLDIEKSNAISMQARAQSIDLMLRQRVALLFELVTKLGQAVRDDAQGEPMVAFRGLEWAVRDTARKVARRVRRPHATRSRSPQRCLAGLSVPLEAWRDAAHSYGGTITDLVCWLAARAVYSHYASRGTAVSDICLAVPVLPTDREVAEGGNAARKLDVVVPSVAIRTLDLALVRDCIEASKLGRERVGEALRGLLRWSLPRPARRVFDDRVLGQYDAAVSNLHEVPVPAFANVSVAESYQFAPAMGCPVALVASSFEDRLFVGITIDPGLIDRSGLLLELACAAKEIDQTAELAFRGFPQLDPAGVP